MTAESLGPLRATQDVMGLVPVPGRPDEKRQKLSQADARKRRAKAAVFEVPPDEGEAGEEAGVQTPPADGEESGEDDPHTIDVKL